MLIGDLVVHNAQAYGNRLGIVDEVRLSDKIGEVFSYNVDHVNTIPDPPNINAVVNFKDGGRVVLRITDRDLDEVRIDMPVEITFRRIHEAGGSIIISGSAVL